MERDREREKNGSGYSASLSVCFSRYDGHDEKP